MEVAAVYGSGKRERSAAVEPELTDRELEVLALVCRGLSDKLIARQLAISTHTVGAHLERVYSKLAVQRDGMNSRCAAMAAAISRGLVSLH